MGGVGPNPIRGERVGAGHAGIAGGPPTPDSCLFPKKRGSVGLAEDAAVGDGAASLDLDREAVLCGWGQPGVVFLGFASTHVRGWRGKPWGLARPGAWEGGWPRTAGPPCGRRSTGGR